MPETFTPFKMEKTDLPGIKTYLNTAGKRFYAIRFYDHLGREREEKGYHTKIAAKRRRVTVLSEVEKGSFIAKSRGRITVKELAELFLASREVGWEETHAAGWKARWRCQLEPKWGTAQIRHINKEHVQEWINDLSKNGYSGNYIRALKVQLAATLNVAVEEGALRVNPAKGVQLPKPATKKTGERYLSHEEVMSIADAVEGDKRAIVVPVRNSR